MAWQFTPQFYQSTTIIVTFTVSTYLGQKNLILNKEKNNYIKNFANYKQNSEKPFFFYCISLLYHRLLNLKSKKMWHYLLLIQIKNTKILNLKNNNLIINLWHNFPSLFNFNFNIKIFKKFCLNNNDLQFLVRFLKCSNIRFLLQIFIFFSFIFMLCYGENKFAQDNTIVNDINTKLLNNIDITSSINGSMYAFILIKNKILTN